MRYRLRHLDLDDKMCQHVNLEIVEQIYPQKIICEQLSLHDAWEERERALNMFVVIHLLLAAALWTRLAFPRVLERLARPLHVLGLPLKACRSKAQLSASDASSWASPPCKDSLPAVVGPYVRLRPWVPTASANG